MGGWFLARLTALVLCAEGLACLALGQAALTTLPGRDGVEATFAQANGGYRWVGYRDRAGERDWRIAGPRFSFETADGQRVNLDEPGFERLLVKDQLIELETALPAAAMEVRQEFSFCPDGRTLRIRTFLRSLAEPVQVKRVGLLELQVSGQDFRLMGPKFVSSPVFGDRLFAGVEHPSAQCTVRGDSFALSQPIHARVGREWTPLPGAVLGSASEKDVAIAGEEALRRAFLRYLDTVRVKPKDLHVHYNDWWTAPVPSSGQFVQRNLAELKASLYDQTGFFFDSYALDAGWSDPKSLWEIDRRQFPDRFVPICAALVRLGSHAGLWISPSSLYPFALDNRWLASAGYEVTPHVGLGFNACLARGGKYQAAFKEAARRYAKEANLAHMKFDGFVARCEVAGHGHAPGDDSYLPIAEGLMDVFDALRAQNPDIALEPTCFGYQPSPWWLMHVPFIIGPFGDDSPYGRCPAPDYVESMTTAREIKNLQGRSSFLMPSSALQCFDIIVQCPGSFPNHAVMAIGRGRWFISSYINPRFMDTQAWRFFAASMQWARHHRAFLQEPLPFGGKPERREAYGYAFLDGARQIICVRNPWMEETTLALPGLVRSTNNVEVRMLYPRPTVIARLAPQAALPNLPLGPYETQLIEMIPSEQPVMAPTARPAPKVDWRPSDQPRIECTIFAPDPPALGPSWTSPDGAQERRSSFVAEGRLSVSNAIEAQLCVLCEGDPAVAENTCQIIVDGHDSTVSISKSQGAFGAAGEGNLEHWIWFLTDVPIGEHEVRIEVSGPALQHPAGVFLRGDVAAPAISAPRFDDGPVFPSYRAGRIPWSRVLVPLAARQVDASRTRSAVRKLLRIDGIYLDTLDWAEASTGWGQAQRNRSIMEKPLTLHGKAFPRGIGAHAASRIVYALPPGFIAFAATIGKDQEVAGGSVVFVVEADGKEAFRSAVFRNDTAAQQISIPIPGVKRLALIVEDAGDNILADHADWAEARLLR
jgi:hypothetical protein